MKKFYSFSKIIAAFFLIFCALSEAQGQIPTNGLVGYWPFNGNANDESGNGNNGTVNGATLTADRFGNAGKAYSFDGVNDYIEVLNSTSINFSTNNFSVSCWILSSNDTRQTVIHKGEGYNIPQYLVRINTDSVHRLFMLISSDYVETYFSDTITIEMSNSIWNHIVVQRNNLSLELFCNGVFINSTSVNIVNTDNSNPLLIGAQNVSLIGDTLPIRDFFEGLIDDIRIYNRALSPSEISAIFNEFGIVTHPISQTICENTNTQFIVAATDTNRSYQWQAYSGTWENMVNMGAYSGTMNDTLTITNVPLSFSGNQFRCIVSNGTTTDTSNIAILTVIAPGTTVTDTINKFIHDGRDCQNYPIVKIGNQWWMKENLNTGTMLATGSTEPVNNSIIEKWCYDNNTANCDIYGGLYNWNEMMQYNVSDTNAVGVTKGVCPSGWHLPTDKEWKTLELALGMSQTQADSIGWRGTDQGGKLKETDTIHWASPNTGATNSSGFTALAGGSRYTISSFADKGISGCWWPATEADATNTMGRYLNYGYSQINRSFSGKIAGFSVRCLKSNCSDIFVNNTISICQGQTYIVGPNTYTISGTYVDTLQTLFGCDSIITTHLFVIPAGQTVTDTINGFIHDGRDCQNYPIVKIGNQWWMKENLNAAKYADGTTIPNVTDGGVWSSLTSGALGYYNNDSAQYAATYGPLYNWYAINDPRGICPTGWQVPGDNEWKILEMGLGMDQATADAFDWRGNDEGSQLKESGTTHWDASNVATNSSGFTALPGGFRNVSGNYSALGSYAYFAVKTLYDPYTSILRSLYAIYPTINRSWGNIENGYSVRCLRSPECLVSIPDVNFKNYLVSNILINLNADLEIQCSEATAFTGTINASGLNISDMTGIEAFTALTNLDCGANNITSLDVSSNTQLAELRVNSCSLTGLSLANNTALTYLDCGSNFISGLNVNANTNLTSLSCQSNLLTSLNVAANTALTELNCGGNQLSDLNVLNNASLAGINCSDNLLTALDVSLNPALTGLICYNNSITGLDVSANQSLDYLDCSNNQLSALNVKNGNNSNFTGFHAENNPGLTCIQVDNAAYSTANWTGVDAGASFSENCNCVPVTSTVNAIICQGQGYTVGPNTYSTSGTYHDSLLTTNGCDSIITTNLAVYPAGQTVTDTINMILHDGRDCQNYPIVKIGSQWWMQENLRTKQFRNGEMIADGSGTGNISSLVNPKFWFIYNDNIAYEDTFGLLYTWHALADNRRICAGGWHAATDNEWHALFDFLGGDTVAGAKMKATGTALWNAPNSGATNESGFTALPAGGRGNTGSFANLHASARFWSASAYNTTTAVRYELTATSNAVSGSNGNKSNGFSVRCLLNNCSDTLVSIASSICQGDSAYLQGTWQHTAGSYIDTFQTSLGCDSIVATALSVYPDPAVSLVADSAACNSITLTAITSGGTGVYAYAWSTGCSDAACSVSTTGTYSVTITDSAGCTASDTNNATVWSVPFISIAGTDSVCTGTTVVMTATIAGGTPPFSYLWSPGYSVMNTYTITPQQNTSYHVAVTDAHQCSGSADYTIAVLPLPVTSAISGSLSVTPPDVVSYFVTDQPGNTYTWTVSGGTIVNGQGTNLINVSWDQQGVGNVCVYETNPDNCSGQQVCITVNIGYSCNGFYVNLQGHDPTCSNSCNGYINTQVTGGTSPFTYSWGDPQHQTGATAVQLCQGTYPVTVTDLFMCTATASISLWDPTAITVHVTSGASHCNTSDGYAYVVATGGIPPYSYSWTSGDTLQTADSLASGMYMVTVTDNNQCQAFTLVTISDQNGPVINVDTVLHLTCYQSHDGSIDISVTGGDQPYTYSWSTGAYSQDISVLEAGPYEIQVSDINSCSASMMISVQQPLPLAVSVSVTESNCGDANGSASVIVSGGTPPYTFLWNTGGTAQNPANMPAGVYYVSVTDSHGCTTGNGTMVSISNNGGPQVAVDSVVAASCSASNGAVYVSITGGAAPYLFAWSDSSATEDNTGILAGDYSVTVTDNNGCIGTGMATVNAIILAAPQICMVLVDSTVTKNLVVWEKETTTAINHYNIYREGSWLGSYFLIGSKNYDETSAFLDTTSHPMNRSYRYRITSVDQCGYESHPGTPHKTMFLAINDGIGNTWNLQWSDYEGFNFPGYYIWRHTSAIGWELLDSIPVGYNFYTDNPSSQGNLKYLVTVRAPYICDPVSAKEMAGPFSQSLSNIEDNGIINPVSIQQTASDAQNYCIYPNPTNDRVVIEAPKSKFQEPLAIGQMPNAKLVIMDIQGREIKSVNLQSRITTVDMKEFSSGVYTIKIITGKDIIVKKLIKQ